MMSPSPARPRSDVAINAVVILSGLALLDSIFNYLWSGNGIHGTEGALLVVTSTFLMLVAAVLISAGRGRGALRASLEVLLVLDFIGTAAAAWLLEAWVLLALVTLAAIAWLIHLFRRAPRPAPVG